LKILITGGFGFIGSHLSESLAKNHQIILLSRSKRKWKNIEKIAKEVKIEYIDVTNFKKLEHCLKKHMPDIIIHLAGETSHSRSFENPLNDVDTNTKSTISILEFIRKYNPKCKFILGSTFIVVGKPKKLPVTEQSSCSPTTVYGTNRLSSETFCKIYHNVYGLKTIVFRITNSFGPREQIIPNKNAINYLIYRAFCKKEITIFNEGKFFRDLIYITDVIDAIKIIMRKGKIGETYWISSGKKIWFSKLGKLLENNTLASVKFTPTPKYTKKVDVGNFIVDNSKLKKLGWKPKISIELGIQNTLDYFYTQKL
jgi:UDP-glucose 4-epimerase